MRIVQVINALDRADAVSQSLLELDRIFREVGWETSIYFEHCHPELRGRGASVAELRPDAGDLLLFHYAGYSRILPRVALFAGPRGVVYHNVTPAHFFADIPGTYEFCQAAVAQLPTLPRYFDFGIGASTFNVEALHAMGFEHTLVLPIPWESSGLAEAEPDERIVARRAGRFPILMVGRTTPHKGPHLAVRALPAIERETGRPVELLLVGKTDGYDSYLATLRDEIRRAGVEDRVVLAGPVSTAALSAYYRSARALLVLSEHEGFCVPIVEAMALGLPVVAAPAGAIEETLGGAGVLLEDRSPETIARAVARVALEGPAREEVLRGQAERAEAFSRRSIAPRARAAVEWALALPRRASRDRVDWPSVSVVVCTYNRDQVLERCLESLRRLDYPAYEIVVVNGPSTDRTREILARCTDVSVVETSERNISVSRNLGIAASAGEIVAFLDDDAVAEPRWLRALASAYDDPAVAAAGGIVLGPGGDHLQFANGIVSLSGRVLPVQESPDDRNDPDGRWYNTLMGTNASFRRASLHAVGGFDENYQYYHDEADLCVRLVQAGFRVAHVPDALVWHGFEPSEMRRNLFDIAWQVVVENTIYFSRCVGGWRRRPWRVLLPLAACLRHLAVFSSWLLRGRTGFRQFRRALSSWGEGIAAGYAKAFRAAPRRALAPSAGTDRLREPARFPRRSGARTLHVALVSQEYPPAPCGGIGVYTESLARGLAAHGHRVSVVTAGDRARFEWRDGVEVYAVPRTAAPARLPIRWTVTRKNLARSLDVEHVLARLVEQGLDLVESPIWDAETFVTSLAPRVPLVVRLNTPIALARETQGWAPSEDLSLAAELEWALLRNAHGVIDPSGTILATVAERFGVRPNGSLVAEIPFGQALPEASAAAAGAGAGAAARAAGTGERAGARNGAGTRFLFVGRLEPRKGIDTLLGAIPRVLARCPEAEIDIAGQLVGDVALPALAADPRVRFHGPVDDRTRAELYAACDVFVAPSRYESFGIVYIEAMSWGKPCIACDAGGAPRIVADTGLLVPPADPAALADAMLALASDPERRERLGRAARRRVEERYGIDAMVRSTVAFYEDVLRLRAARAA